MRPILLSSLLLHLSAVLGTHCPGGGAGDCKYQCNQGIGSVSVHEFSSPSSLFLSPCSCNEGWNDVFCSQPHIYSRTAVIGPHTPTVCICRQKHDSGLRCEQFLTRCYKKAEGGCKCCFMQDEEYCDHVECKDDVPRFQDTNTTCDCFSQPAQYPTEICRGYSEHMSRDGKPDDYYLSVLGFQVNAFHLLAAVVVVLFCVGVITMCCLIVSSNRRKRAREERERAQRERRERLGLPAETEVFLH